MSWDSSLVKMVSLRQEYSGVAPAALRSHPIRDQPGMYSSTFWHHSLRVNKSQNIFTIKPNQTEKTFWSQEHWWGHSVPPSGYALADSWSTNHGSLGTLERILPTHPSLKYCGDPVLTEMAALPPTCKAEFMKQVFPRFPSPQSPGWTWVNGDSWQLYEAEKPDPLENTTQTSNQVSAAHMPSRCLLGLHLGL